MDVNVDNERTLTLDAVPADTLALAAALNEHLKKQGLIIKSLTIDGADVLAAEYTAGAVPIVESTVIQVVTEGAGAFAERLLKELDEVLSELPAACHALAAVFQGNAPTEGFDPFQRLAEIWSVVKTREMEAACAMDYCLEEIRVGGMSLQRMHEDLNRYLEEAVEALESNDCVLLGDLLEYELAPRAKQEADIVAALRERIAQQSA